MLKYNMEEQKVQYIDLKKTSNYESSYQFKFDVNMGGIRSYQSLYSSNDTFEEPDKFNKWNFTTAHLWK